MMMNRVSETVDGPATPRGRRTRAALVDAAAAVFAEQNYLDTTIGDIAKRAQVAHGTFYTYFDSKEAIFREVALELQQRMLRSRRPDAPAAPPAFETRVHEILWRIMRAHQSFLEAYRENAALLAVIEQVATFSAEMKRIRRAARVGFVDRSERAIRRLQDDHLVCRDVDARLAAAALGAMLDRFAYLTFVLGEPADFDESVRTMGLLWARAIGLDVPDGFVTPSVERPPRGGQETGRARPSPPPPS